MKLKNNIVIYILLLLATTSCNGQQDISNKELNGILNKSLSDYSEKKDIKILEKAYSNLKKNKDFRENGLVNGISFSTISLLINLKKYDELERLLITNKILHKYNRQVTLNTVRFLKYVRTDKLKAEKHIYENIKLVQDTIKKNPQDTLLYGDYFSAKMYLRGKEKTLNEIDSMFKKTDKYRNIFRESIEIYPEELLPK